MQKYVNPIPNGGAPLHNNRLNGELQLEFWDVIEGKMSPFNADTQGVILTGCVISGSGPYAMTAGIVYLNGEFMRIPAQASFSLPQYIQPDVVVNVAKTFGDGSSQTLLVNKSAKIAGTAPGSGQYVAITTATDPDDRRYTSNWVTTTLVLTDLQNQAAANPTVMTSGKFKYKMSPGKIEIDLDIYGVTFSGTPSQIYVLVPLAIRPYVLAFMRDTGAAGARLMNGQVDPATGTLVPSFVGYSNSKTSLLFIPASGTFLAASPLSLSTQFVVLT